MADERFYVYAIMDGDICAYVGKGCGSRSAASARKYGGEAKILKRFKCEDHAYLYERKMIAELLPTENKNPGGSGGRAIPQDPLPKSYVGKITEREWATAQKEYKRFQAVLNEVGPRRYVARFLLQPALRGMIDASKVDQLRQVAHGEWA